MSRRGAFERAQKNPKVFSEEIKPARRMPCILTPRFAGKLAPPSPEVEAGPYVSPEDSGVKSVVAVIAIL